MLKKMKIITALRLVNFLKLFWVYLFKKNKNPNHNVSQPFSITLELASICNLQCPECKMGQGKVVRRNPIMSLETAKKIIDRHSKTAFIIQLFFQGEPFLNPQWFEIVKYAASKKLYTVINTNGHFLNSENCKKIAESKLKRIIISLDGATSEVYSQYRKNGNFDTVIQGIKNLVEMRKILKTKRPKIIIQSLLTRETEKQIPEFKKLCRKLGVDSVIFKTMQLYDFSEENKNKWLPKKQKYNRYYKKTSIKSKTNCWRTLSTAVYTSDGDLVPCCFDKTAEFNFGNIDKEPWNSTQRKTFLSELIKKQIKPGFCSNCY